MSFSMKLLGHIFYVHIMEFAFKTRSRSASFDWAYTGLQGTNIYGFYDAHVALQIITLSI